MILAFLLTGACLIPDIRDAWAQRPGQWAPARPIPGLDHERPPMFIADQNNTVHAFNSQRVGLGTQDIGILYRQWSLDGGWTQPVDIFVPWPTVNSPLLDVILDPDGVFHLIYYGGQQEDGQIYYTHAYASVADRATSWSKPVRIGEGAGPLSAARIFRDDDGRMIVIYSGQRDGNGLYQIRSDDNGLNWVEATPIYLVSGADRWAHSIMMDMDSQRQLHMVWSIVNELGLGEEVLYARLDATWTNWSQPYRLAALEGNDYSANWPTIYIYRDELFVIYMDSFPAARFMRRSQDGGETWSPPIRPFPHIGEYGHAVMVEDGSGQLHLLLGNRIGNPEIHGMWHSVWLGDRWSSLQAVISGPRTDAFDPSSPKAVISQGRVLLVAWWNNVREADVAWYSYLILDLPEDPSTPLPQPPTPTPTMTPEVRPTLTLPMDSNQPGTDNSLDSSNQEWGAENPGLPLIVGILPAVLLIAVVLYVKRPSSRY
jgi:hypothetical protein